jgi:gliding motility-associated-like protein
MQFHCSYTVVAQAVFYQDIFKGGVTVGGFSTGLGTGSGFINLHIEQGSVIRKAFIFTYSTGENTSQLINVNNTNYLFDPDNTVVFFPFKNTYFSPISLHCIDITNELNNLLTSQFIITIPTQLELPFKGVFAPLIYITYENTTLSTINASIVLNKQSLIGNEYYGLNNINPIFTNYPVGFSIYTDRTAPFGVPNSEIFFNNNLLGLIGGTDNVNSMWGYAGVKGHFYYQNNQLFGLDDDTPDAVMGGTDGLADVSSYITNNTTSCDFQIKDIQYPNQPPNATNVNLAYFLNYATPCPDINPIISSDTIICQGQTLQLLASTGTSTGTAPAFEWQCLTDTAAYGNSVYGLSCKDCANPVFSGDKSAVYTVRIWNGDSCSVVRPVRVTVLPKPKNGGFSTINSQCDNVTGVLKIDVNESKETFFAISDSGDTLQTTTNSIQFVGVGDYTVFYADTNGCISNDSLVNVSYLNNVTANFTVNPTSGTAPLAVTIYNNSQNATSYQWYENSNLISTSPSFFDSSGTYHITLMAYGNNPECVDSVTKNVFVYDSLILEIPNVFTPNNDGANDLFMVNCNLPSKAKIILLNRWGNEIFVFEGMLNVGYNSIWNGTLSSSIAATDGVYFYNMEIVDMKENKRKINGFFHLIR